MYLYFGGHDQKQNATNALSRGSITKSILTLSTFYVRGTMLGPKCRAYQCNYSEGNNSRLDA